MATSSDYAGSVFINCPFDNNYLPLFRALTFAVIDCGFYARSAQEIDDASEVRINKIERLISECKFGIHDISCTELDTKSRLPRFNMPFELGLFLGAKKYGSHKQKDKKCLILDRTKYRYQKYLSDIAGQDIKAHKNQQGAIIKQVSEFLRGASGRKTIPGGTAIVKHYNKFKRELPSIILASQLEEKEMGFQEFSTFAFEWLQLQAEE